MNQSVTLDCFRPCTADLQVLENIYIASFPPDERRPWTDIVSSVNFPKILTVRSDGGAAIGFLTYWDFGTVVYIEHFAVTAELRGNGLGAKALKTFIAMMAPRPVVLEAEPPGYDNPLATRRLDFYRRNGFDILTKDYIQPPYTSASNPVALYILSTSPDLSPAEITATLHHRVYKKRG